jgi:hypothetical protein
MSCRRYHNYYIRHAINFFNYYNSSEVYVQAVISAHTNTLNSHNGDTKIKGPDTTQLNRDLNRIKGEVKNLQT